MPRPLYKAHARKIEEIPYDKINQGTGRRYQGDVYVCRKDEAGKKLDKAAMLVCSKAWGITGWRLWRTTTSRGL